MGAFIIHPCLPFVAVIANSRAASLHGHYSSSPLLPAPPPPSRLPPLSWCCQLYGFLLRRFLAGTGRASPVAQCILVLVLSLSPRQSVPPHQSVCDGPCCLRPMTVSSASGAWLFGGHLCVHFRYSPRTCSPSQGWLCQSTSFASFPPRMRFKLQSSDFSSGGPIPTEYISLLLDIRSRSLAP